jgi:hypothetical protein
MMVTIRRATKNGGASKQLDDLKKYAGILQNQLKNEKLATI